MIKGECKQFWRIGLLCAALFAAHPARAEEATTVFFDAQFRLSQRGWFASTRQTVRPRVATASGRRASVEISGPAGPRFSIQLTPLRRGQEMQVDVGLSVYDEGRFTRSVRCQSGYLEEGQAWETTIEDGEGNAIEAEIRARWSAPPGQMMSGFDAHGKPRFVPARSK